MILPVKSWPPTAGTYAARLVKGGPRVPVRIWYGQAIVDGEEQDRAPGWFVEIDGATDRLERDDDTGYRCRVALKVESVWPHCARWPISETRYRYMLEHARWAREHAPDHPKATPRQPVDFHALPPRF